MVKLMEQEVELKVLSPDLQLVKDIKKECESDFSKYIKDETGKDFKTNLTIN